MSKHRFTVELDLPADFEESLVEELGGSPPSVWTTAELGTACEVAGREGYGTVVAYSRTASSEGS